MILAILLASVIGIIWHMPLLFLAFTPFYLYKLTDKAEIVKIQNLLKDKCYSSMIYQDKPFGFIYGRWFFGFINSIIEQKEENITVYLFCTKTCWETTLHETIKAVSEVNLWETSGNFFWILYNKRSLSLDKYKVQGKQTKISKSIIQIHKKSNNCVCLISGEPGGGKSTVALIVAKILKKSSIIFSWNPTLPGYNISTLYNKVQPTKDSPLIIVLDEIDVAISKFPIAQHKHIPTEIYDKSSWNMFFDSINRGLYPHLIIIMTTNRPADFVDESLLRKGRVDAKFVM